MVKFYMDAHVPGAVTRGLHNRGVDVLTVQQDHHDEEDDDLLLRRATFLNRVLVSMDRDFEKLVAQAQVKGQSISGVVAFSRSLSYRQCIDDLELIAKCSEASEWADRYTKLPI